MNPARLPIGQQKSADFLLPSLRGETSFLILRRAACSHFPSALGLVFTHYDVSAMPQSHRAVGVDSCKMQFAMHWAIITSPTLLGKFSLAKLLRHHRRHSAARQTVADSTVLNIAGTIADTIAGEQEPGSRCGVHLIHCTCISTRT